MDVFQHRQRARGLLLGLLVAIALITGLSQALAAADDGDRRPTPEPGALPETSPYAAVISTTAELLATEWSVERYVAAHSIPAGLLAPANLTQSEKTVSPENVAPNGTTRFTITVVNSGNSDVLVTVTDDLPNQFDYVDHSCIALLTDSCGYSGGVVTWKGTAIAGQEAVVQIDAKLKQNVQPDTKITNTAQIKGGGNTINVSAQVTVKNKTASPFQFLPFAIRGLEPEPQAVVLTPGVPNGSNEWTMTWTPGQGSTSYELQESLSPGFEGGYTYAIGPVTNWKITQQPSFTNVFYYRVRSVIGAKRGPWSNTVSVVGGYFDDFKDPASGWKMRRTTYLEEVRSYYEIDGSRNQFVMFIDDRWDWGIASPGAPAPRLPYVIEYEAKIVDPSVPNVTSGFVFGGDWPSTAGCPSDPGSFDGIYKHDDCFNHFYNTNGIFYGKANGSAIKLLFERVDQLVWCLGCGGSPMKRTGDINTNQASDYRGIDSEGWNKYRIEVRQSGIKVFAGKRDGALEFQREYGDTRWTGSPFFGVFASTDEYSDSVWRFDYVRVMPLDN